jgi:hypothetical protein
MDAKQKLQAAIDELRDAGAITNERRQQLEDMLDEACDEARTEGQYSERDAQAAQQYYE